MQSTKCFKNVKLRLPFQRAGGLEQLSVGMQGVLITTGDQEKFCVSEAYSLLNEVHLHIDVLFVMCTSYS